MSRHRGEIRSWSRSVKPAWLLLATAVVWLASANTPARGVERSTVGEPGERQSGEEVPADKEQGEPALENTLRWKTASEVDNFGFDVYRGDSEDGPFERLTEEPIPGAGTTDEPQQYVFVDDTIEAGKAYWYYVESISMMGVREQFTPVFEAEAKGGAETPEAEGSADGSGDAEEDEGGGDPPARS